MGGGIVFTTSILAALMACITTCMGTACFDVDRPSCLNAVLTAAEDRNKFWFGNDYPSRCNSKSEFDSECYNPRANFRDSLMSRIFQSRPYNKNTVKHVLSVTYQTNTGTFQACGNTFLAKESRVVDIDPLMDDVGLKPFECLKRPTVSWKNSPPSNSFHTLAIIDAGYLTLQGLYVNLPGNSLDGGETVVEYQPPLNPTQNNNPYVFLLFEQNSTLALHPQTLHDLSLRNVDTFNTFLTQNNVHGPVGLSWFTVRADPYAADNAAKSPGRMNTCAYFIDEALRKMTDIPFLPSNRPPLNTYLDVTFDSPAFQYSCCCNRFYRDRVVFKPNPIGDAIGDPAVMRINASLVFQKSTAFPTPSRDFGDDLYTLMMPDPYGGSPNKSLPYMHMLVTDIRGGQLETGRQVLPYTGPWPQQSYYHRYYYLLFKQTRRNFNPNPIDYNAFPECTKLSEKFYGRCGFKMDEFIRDGGLELVGASWQRVRISDYVRCVYAHLPNFPKSKWCASFPDYTPNCAVDNGASAIGTGGLVARLLVLMSLMSSLYKTFHA